MNSVTTRAAALKQLIEREGEAAGQQRMAEAIVDCCRELVEAGESRIAISLADSSAVLARRAGEDWLVRLGVVRAEALADSGRPEESLRFIEGLHREHHALIARPSNEAYRLRIGEARALWQLNRAAEAVQMLNEIRSELLTRPDSALLALCALQLSAAEAVRGNYDVARESATEAVVSARRCRARSIEARSLRNLALLERQRCRWSNAEESGRRALAILEEDGNRSEACHAKRSLGVTEWKRGRLEAALDWTNRSLEDASSLQHEQLKWYGSLLKGMILLHAGDHETAAKLFPSAAAWNIPEAESRPSLLTAEFLGDISLEQGRVEEALGRYDNLWPKALALVPKGDIVAELRRRRAECYLLLGRAADAYEEAKVGLDHCRELGDRYEEAATYRVLALAAAALGKAQEAKRHFTQGFAYYDDIETPYEWGKLWLAYGDWLRGPHAAEYADARGALEAYQAARDHFERMGAQAKLAEANARIAEHATNLAPVAPSAGLSPAPAAPAQPNELRRPQRRPRGSADLERRSKWALETFGLVTRHKHMLALLEEVAQLARGGAPILVVGESGTGKELIAAGIHRLSGRRGTYLALNSSAVPREVIENELFGHVAGGFTGATQGKAGLFEVCDGGTVFLDEIAEMPLELQAKLLRFLESGEVRRVGATKNVRVDTRVVAATNRERTSLERGEGLRRDLYYRLAHAVVELPGLRHRGEDVELLMEHFLEEACAEERKRVTLSAAARRKLLAYAWPGNVRQMKSVLGRVVRLAQEAHEVGAGQLRLEETTVATTLMEELGEAEKRRVVEVLRQVGGSRTEAAKVLGVPRTTLINKIRRYGLE